MSALGQKRTFTVQQVMSALPPIATVKATKADIGRRETPRADRRCQALASARQKLPLCPSPGARLAVANARLMRAWRARTAQPPWPFHHAYAPRRLGRASIAACNRAAFRHGPAQLQEPVRTQFGPATQPVDRISRSPDRQTCVTSRSFCHLKWRRWRRGPTIADANRDHHSLHYWRGCDH